MPSTSLSSSALGQRTNEDIASLDVTFEYVDQFDAFTDEDQKQHQLCAGAGDDEEWLHGIIEHPTDFLESLHPKARGQQALANRVWKALR